VFLLLFKINVFIIHIIRFRPFIYFFVLFHFCLFELSSDFIHSC